MAPRTGNDAGGAPNSAGNGNTTEGGTTPTQGKKGKPFKKNLKKKSGKDKKKPVPLVLHVPKVSIVAFQSKPITEQGSVTQLNEWIEVAADHAKNHIPLWAVLNDDKRPFVAPVRGDFVTLSGTLDDAEKIEFQIQMKNYNDYMKVYGALMTILLACCNTVVRTEIKDHSDYETAKTSRNFIGMLNIVDAVCHTGTFGTRLPPQVKRV